MLAQLTYKKTAVEAQGTMAHGGLTTVGTPPDPIAGYEAFADEVAKVGAMEAQSLVAITYRHQESQTGKKYVDVLRFTRLK